MEKELIKLKGTADGVKIYLDSECEFSKLMNSLYEKIRQKLLNCLRNFFRKTLKKYIMRVKKSAKSLRKKRSLRR